MLMYYINHRIAWQSPHQITTLLDRKYGMAFVQAIRRS